jgi:hypothetical protein
MLAWWLVFVLLESPVVAWQSVRMLRVSIQVSWCHFCCSSWWPSTHSHASEKGKRRAISSISWTSSHLELRLALAKAGLGERPELSRLIKLWFLVVIQIHGADAAGCGG